MKKYKVLEAHQGDRFYMPGDGENGTRIADENAVGHLVTLGLLEEIGDVEDAPLDAAVGSAPANELQMKIDVLVGELEDTRAKLTAAEADRDEATKSLNAAITEHGSLRAQLNTANTDLEAVRADLTKAQATQSEGQPSEPAPAGHGRRARGSN